MANPTLVGSETPHAGFTVAQAAEEVLKAAGLTNDATTGRTVADVAQAAEALVCVRRAVDALFTRYPNLYAIRTVSGTWVSGDHSLALPANVGQPLTVRYNGVDLRPWSRDDLERSRRPTDQGGGVATEDSGRPEGYRLTGYATEAAPGGGHTQVLRLYPTPAGTFAAQGYEVDFVAMGPALTALTATLPIWPTLQTWVVAQAKQFWAAPRNYSAGVKSAALEQAQAENVFEGWIESGMREHPSRVTWRRPNPTTKRASRYGK